jgi:hypothetical protein
MVDPKGVEDMKKSVDVYFTAQDMLFPPVMQYIECRIRKIKL